MLIEELKLNSRNLDEQYKLFVDLLELEAEEISQHRLEFKVGQSRLVFERRDEEHEHYHYAINIPGHRFTEAVRWLKVRCPLLANAEGQHEFFFEAWNAHGVYFADADGNIVELIARHDLQSQSEEAFDSSCLLSVGEVGLVVKDVFATVDSLEREYGMKPYLGLRHPEFTAVGDDQGMFVVVQTHRPWLPTAEPAKPASSSTTFRINNNRYTFSIT